MTKSLQAAIEKTITGAILFTLLFMSGCSFHSNQWDAMKRLLRPSEVPMQDRWILSGSVSNTEVYPVQVSGAILFTDGKDILLKFDGWHFVEIRGLADAHSETISEELNVRAFNYLVTDTFNNEATEEEMIHAQKSIFSGDKNRIVYKVSCEAWQKVPVWGGELLSQSCTFDIQGAFSNSIWLDQSGNIRALETVVGPGGGKVRVAMRDR